MEGLPTTDRPYPRNLVEFDDWYKTEEACIEYLTRIRWPIGVVCPYCRDSKVWKTGVGRWKCGKCRRKVSVTAGTLFQDTHKPLRQWFRAMWHVTNEKNGASALSIQRSLGLGSYKTAWLWLHKLRRAMVRPDRDKISGRVEVDETYVGGETSGPPGRGSLKKSLVAIAVQENGKGIGRLRMERVRDASAKSLIGFVISNVECGSLVHTDGWNAYNQLESLGFKHHITTMSDHPVDVACDLLPRVHLVASLLKRWLLGTHQGAVRAEHLDYYLDEFTFRFNRRTSSARGMLFYRLIQQAVCLSPVASNKIFGGRSFAIPQPVGDGPVK